MVSQATSNSEIRVRDSVSRVDHAVTMAVQRLGWIAIVLLMLYLLVGVAVAAVIVNRIVTASSGAMPTHCPTKNGVRDENRVLCMRLPVYH